MYLRVRLNGQGSTKRLEICLNLFRECWLFNFLAVPFITDVFILPLFSPADVIESIIDEHTLMIYISLLKRKVGFIRLKKEIKTILKFYSSKEQSHRNNLAIKLKA